MTDQEKTAAVEKLAKFMGWEEFKYGAPFEFRPNGQRWWCKISDKQKRVICTDFRPYEDRNHLQMVLDKVLEKPALWSMFCRHWHLIDHDNRLGEYMKATPEQIISALLPLLPND